MGRRVFFKSFFITLAIMLACYGMLVFSMGGNARETDTPQQGVAVNQPSPDDSRTVFVTVGDEQARFFFLVKFNGYQQAVSVVSVSPSYIYPTKNRSLSQSMEIAGVMQCVLDTKEEFGIDIHHYISCSWDGMRKLLEDFTEFGIDQLGENLPPVVKSLLLKSRQKVDADSIINAVEMTGHFLDNEIGLGFLNEAVYLLLRYNGENIHSYAGSRLKANYSSIDTNINTSDLKDYERVLKFIHPNTAQYLRQVVVAEEGDGVDKVREAVLE